MWSELRIRPTSYQAGGGVLNRLQSVHQSFRHIEEERVSVVQAIVNERLDHYFTRIIAADQYGSRFDRPQ